MGIDFDVLVDDGLANNSYLLDLGDGWALAVDASRALRALRDRARHRGLRVAVAADTHLCTPTFSPVPRNWAPLVRPCAPRPPTADRRGFPHQGLYDGDEVDPAPVTSSSATLDGGPALGLGQSW